MYLSSGFISCIVRGFFKWLSAKDVGCQNSRQITATVNKKNDHWANKEYKSVFKGVDIE